MNMFYKCSYSPLKIQATIYFASKKKKKSLRITIFKKTLFWLSKYSVSFT